MVLFSSWYAKAQRPGIDYQLNLEHLPEMHLTECIPYVQNTVYIDFVNDWGFGNFSKSDPKLHQAAWKRDNPNFLFNVCDSSDSLWLSPISVPVLKKGISP